MQNSTQTSRIQDAMRKDIAMQDAIIRDALETYKERPEDRDCAIRELIEAEVRQNALKRYLQEFKDNATDKLYMDMIRSLEEKLNKNMTKLCTNVHRCLIFAGCCGMITLFTICLCYYI